MNDPSGGRVRGSKTYEMLWDCQFCGTKGLLGKSQRFCPNCGAPQNPDSRYYPDESQMVEVIGHEYVGADVICPACNQLNGAKADFCQQCGSPLKEGKVANVLAAQQRAADGQFASSGPRDVVKEQFDAMMAQAQGSSGGGGSRRGLMIGLGIVALIVVGLVVFFGWRRETTLIVAGHSWERVILIDEYRNFTESNWHDLRPAGDNVVMGMCVQRQRSTRQVPDGETCTTVRMDQGDGTFRQQEVCSPKYRSEPVYDNWCTFSGQRYEAARRVPTSGASLNQTPVWGEPNLRCANQRSVGCERERGREERYIVRLSEPNRVHECVFNDQAKWQSFGIETAWKGQTRVIDGALDCGTLTKS
ncbi:MAG: zinc ribbon domain-containing protein [Anaerolineae bacterium]|nr:zinc ribbon domain-containing protein [Anaerolineae bacterium]MDW8172853.1 zinc ribbon domain-containing protein [Anaerolineae bacterium]